MQPEWKNLNLFSFLMNRSDSISPYELELIHQIFSLFVWNFFIRVKCILPIADLLFFFCRILLSIRWSNVNNWFYSLNICLNDCIFIQSTFWKHDINLIRIIYLVCKKNCAVDAQLLLGFYNKKCQFRWENSQIIRRQSRFNDIFQRKKFVFTDNSVIISVIVISIRLY